MDTCLDVRCFNRVCYLALICSHIKQLLHEGESPPQSADSLCLLTLSKYDECALHVVSPTYTPQQASGGREKECTALKHVKKQVKHEDTSLQK